MGRRLAREKAMQVVFQIDVGKIQPDIAIENIMQETELASDDFEFFKKLVDGVLANLYFLDEKIKKYTIDWDIERLANVDRNILRLAVYEMYFLPTEIPQNVSINEAIELVKKFGNPESSKYINGILDRIKKEAVSQMGDKNV
ncbi:transcription antitermination factor NusB [Bacillota bacterium LX-D]|nr:transcription antitermination factor NusB [Bacillota bacterium LX-D]